MTDNKILIVSKRKKIENVQKEYPNSKTIDVTSKAEKPWIKFSPFYPHGKIPIPFSEGHYSYSVEGLWQGLKVFESEGIDARKFDVQNMKGIKRSVRKFGKVLGHQRGVNGADLFTYQQARKEIYLPAYHYTLNNYLQNEISEIKKILLKKTIVLLDYETNTDINNLKKPLSHASLIAEYIKGAL